MPPPEKPPRDGPSIIAFVTSIFSLLVFSVPLAIWGLARTSGYQRRGRGLAIAALVISSLWTALIVVGTVAFNNQLTGVSQAPGPGTTAEAAVAIPTTEAAGTPVTAGTTPPAGHQPTGPLKKKKRVYWDQVKVGDCLNEQENSEFVTVVDCRVAHRDETSFTYRLSRSMKWPGQQAMNASADARCQAAFATYVGISFDDSELSFGSSTPDSETWKYGDRLVLCFVYSPASDTLTKSLRGARV